MSTIEKCGLFLTQCTGTDGQVVSEEIRTDTKDLVATFTKRARQSFGDTVYIVNSQLIHRKSLTPEQASCAMEWLREKYRAV